MRCFWKPIPDRLWQIWFFWKSMKHLSFLFRQKNIVALFYLRYLKNVFFYSQLAITLFVIFFLKTIVKVVDLMLLLLFLLFLSPSIRLLKSQGYSYFYWVKFFRCRRFFFLFLDIQDWPIWERKKRTKI